ncbi:acyl carrier protein [Polymorphospora sp. NPDC051019]|uniref:acyl carrier protein n=1 Tax=Polymorphospora sp. NPDC051019 TaxID=3155725 RepID=UPI003420549F
MSAQSDELEKAVTRLQSMLRDVWDECPPDLEAASGVSLLDLGVDSLTLVTLLDRVEREFHVTWDADDPPGADSSLRTLARLAVGAGPHGVVP